MNEMKSDVALAVGLELIGPTKRVTAERIEWYDSGMLSTAKGELAQVGDNIHTDDKFARNQGLPAVILDGMVSTNWCQTMLIEYFGMDYIERGSLRTKYIKPIDLDQTVSVRARVRSADRMANGDVECDLDVWCEVDGGVKVVDGDARVLIAAKR
jgi:3-hydroxybutyryl-CoA dehydratase